MTNLEGKTDNLTPASAADIKPEDLQSEPLVPPSSRWQWFSRHRRWLSIIGLMAGLIALGGVAWWQYGRHWLTKPSTPVTIKPSVSATPVADVLLQRFMHPTTGEVWLTQAKKLPDQQLMADTGADTQYYEVGKHGQNAIYMMVQTSAWQWILLYEQAADGKITIVLHPDGEAVYSQDQDPKISDFRKAVTLSRDIHYDSLTLPRTVDLDKGYVLSKPTAPTLGLQVSSLANGSNVRYTALRTIGQSTLQRSETVYADTKLTSIGYSIVTPLQTRISLQYTPLELDLTNYQWQRGYSTPDTLEPISRGCSLSAVSVSRADAVTDADTQSIGRSPSGQTVYEFKDAAAPLLVKAFQEFSTSGMTRSSDYPNAASFARDHGLVLYKDRFGQWLVYVRSQLRPGYGCAKPVIYLYPQQPQAVKVQVGAQVRVSEPQYDATQGWRVWAEPSGHLTVGRRGYGSLFWDGLGFGPYPGVTAGTVVRRDQAVATIRVQLAAQGLRGREIDDFMAYWTPRLPASPYVRLTWFDTAQMNALAPLAVSPRPDTMIRVFLDFAGLDAPINLPAQHFTAPARQGFTLVEWGGLSTSIK